MDWYNLFRDLMSKDLVDHPIILGGPGRTVVIDESIFRGKRKYNRGRILPRDPWIFGAIERESGKVAVFVVPNRTRAELMVRIEQYIAPGTTIVSYDWPSYRQINKSQ